MNSVNLTGRITHDPEVKKTNDGTSVANFALAVKRPFSKDKTDFIDCVAWRHQADFLGSYIKKGALLGVTGRIEVQNYEDKDGNKRKSVSVVVESVESLESQTQKQSTPKDAQVYEESAPTLDITSSDLPF